MNPSRISSIWQGSLTATAAQKPCVPQPPKAVISPWAKCAAVERPASAVLHIDLVKACSIPGVRLETEDFIMPAGFVRPMEDAARMAYRDLVRWLVEDYGFEQTEASFPATRDDKMRVGNWVDTKYTPGASMLKQYME